MLSETKSYSSSYLCWPLGLVGQKNSISLNFQMQIFVTKFPFLIITSKEIPAGAVCFLRSSADGRGLSRALTAQLFFSLSWQQKQVLSSCPFKSPSPHFEAMRVNIYIHTHIRMQGTHGRREGKRILPLPSTLWVHWIQGRSSPCEGL